VATELFKDIKIVSKTPSIRIGVYLGRHAGTGGGMAIYAQSLMLALSRHVDDRGLQDSEFVFYGDSVVLSDLFSEQIEGLDLLCGSAPPHSLRPASQYFKELGKSGGQSEVRKLRILLRKLGSFGGRHLNMIFDQVILPLRLLYDGVDILHSTSNVAILATSLPQVVTVHDLYQAWPPAKPRSKLSSLLRFIYRWVFKLQFSKIDKVIVDTKTIEREIVSRFSFTKSRINNIFLGVDDSFLSHWRARGSDKLIARARAWSEQKGIPSGYVLLTASSDPRKNLDACLSAWKSLSPELRAHGLVLKCLDDGARKKCRQHLRGEDNVFYLGWLERDEMPLLLACARVVLLATHAEGFGLPVLEAFATGTPVVSGPIEVVKTFGQGAKGLVYTCDPSDTESIVEALKLAITEGTSSACARMLGNDRQYRPALQVPAQGTVMPGRNGTPQPRSFAETAEETYAVYRELSYRGRRSLA
jgi:alpha-1,3-rhamnosyl/mannosyltransferase